MISLTMGHLLRSEGHAKQASAGMMFGGILNVVLDPVLIFGFQMGVAGAAIATAFSNGASVVFFVVEYLRLKGKTSVSLHPRYFTFRFVGQIFSVGLASALAKETRHLGIRAMLVEPGAFRTGFYDQRLQASSQNISDYDCLARQYRKDCAVNAHNQLGDPEKGGEVVVEMVLRKDAPFRLMLGSDAVKAAVDALESRLSEIHAWKRVSRQTDFAKSQQ